MQIRSTRYNGVRECFPGGFYALKPSYKSSTIRLVSDLPETSILDVLI